MSDDPSTHPTERRSGPRAALIGDAATRAIRYVEGERSRAVYPDRSAIAALDRFRSELPEHGRPPSEVLAQLDELGSPATVASTGGRYFGFVTGGTDPVAVGAAILAAAWDQNAALPVMSPVAARLDRIAADWVCRVLGLPPGATAGFCSGASIANLTCIVAARDALLARRGWDVGIDGLSGAPPIPVVASEEVHVSVLKALRTAGLGRRSTTLVGTDERGRLDLTALPPLSPGSLVVGQAGNVDTGHSDPFTGLAPLVAEAGGWLHVDGAFGLWAAASPEHRHLVEGVEAADSWAVDAHKWLNVSYDSALAICARADDLLRSMATDAAYLGSEPGRASMHLGLQMSQRARAVEAWAVLAARGRSGVAELVASGCRQAARMAALLAGRAELLAPVALNQVLVAFGSDEATDAVIDEVQRDGTCWVGPTTWKGRRAMRISLSDSSTTDGDVDAAAAAILACAARRLDDR